MDDKLEQEIYAKYPALYRQKDLPMTETCMCWGLACGSGWVKIIDDMSRKLTAYAKKTGMCVEAEQVKEKYGILHVYINFSDETVDRIVDAATNLSARTCELCGSTKDAHINKGPWFEVRCKACRAKLKPKNI